VDAILYVNKTGFQWRLLPKDFPPWESVYGYFRRWRLSGLWNRLWKALREQAQRQAGRTPEPSVAIVDSQSVKSTLKGGSEAMTRARKPKAANATSRSTHKASCSR
jgi:transposase